MAGLGLEVEETLENSKTVEENEERYVAFFPRDKPAFRVVLNVDKLYPQNVSIKFICENSKKLLKVKMIHDSRMDQPSLKLYQHAYEKNVNNDNLTAADSRRASSSPKNQSPKNSVTNFRFQELCYSRNCTYKFQLPRGVKEDSLSVVWTSKNFLVISSLETKDDIMDFSSNQKNENTKSDTEDYRIVSLHVACDDSPRVDLYSFRSFAREVFCCTRDALGDVENNSLLPEGESILDGLKELNFRENDVAVKGWNNLTDACNGEQHNSGLPVEKYLKVNKKDITDFLTETDYDVAIQRTSLSVGVAGKELPPTIVIKEAEETEDPPTQCPGKCRTPGKRQSPGKQRSPSKTPSPSKHPMSTRSKTAALEQTPGKNENLKEETLNFLAAGEKEDRSKRSPGKQRSPGRNHSPSTHPMSTRSKTTGLGLTPVKNVTLKQEKIKN